MTAAVAAASLVIGGLTAGLGRLADGTAGKNAATTLPPAAGPVPTATATAKPSDLASAKPGTPGRTPPGTAIGPARSGAAAGALAGAPRTVRK